MKTDDTHCCSVTKLFPTTNQKAEMGLLKSYLLVRRINLLIKMDIINTYFLFARRTEINIFDILILCSFYNSVICDSDL